jgi:putative ABC transport system permease protein
MIKNYIKIAWRNLWKGRVFNLMNIAGLAIAIACCTLIFLTVFYEFSYDRFHTKLDDIYQVYQTANRPAGAENNTAMPIPLTPTLKAEYPSVKYITRSANMSALVKYGTKEIDQSAHLADQDFLKMFTFPLLQGNSGQVLAERNNVALTEKAAKAIFGNETAVGKTISLNIENSEQPFIVSGIMKDIPDNSSITFDILVRFDNFPFYNEQINAWDNRSHRVFVQFKEGYNTNLFTKQIKPFVNKYYEQDVLNLKKEGAKPDANGNIFSLNIAPFSNNHFANTLGGVEGNAINKTYPISLLTYQLHVALHEHVKWVFVKH